VAIWGDFGTIKIKEEWVKHHYELDEQRGDNPCERWVLSPVTIYASRVAVAVALDKNEAIIKVEKSWIDF